MYLLTSNSLIYPPPFPFGNHLFALDSTYSGSEDKESTRNAGDWGLISGLGRSTGEGNGYPLQYSCLENSMDRGAWQAIVHGVVMSQK